MWFDRAFREYLSIPSLRGKPSFFFDSLALEDKLTLVILDTLFFKEVCEYLKLHGTSPPSPYI
jgi:hypothetical protein